MTIRLRESFFDGYAARFVLDVIPKAEQTALIPDMVSLDDPYATLPYTLEVGESEDEDFSVTVLEGLRACGFERCYLVAADVHDPAYGEDDLSGDFIVHEDGSATLYQQVLYHDYHSAKDFEVTGISTPVVDGKADWEQRTRQDFTIHLEAAPITETQVYRPAEDGGIADAGIRVDAVRLTVAPQELYYIVEMTIVDEAAYAETDEGFLVEFIDPESTAAEPYAQRLRDGLTGVGSSSYVDEDGKHSDVLTLHLRQTGSLARSELHDSYVLRGFNCWEKNRYGTTVVEKEAE